MLVILWTDALIFLLIVLSLLFGFVAHRREHLREPWRRIVRSKVGMGSLVVLAVFVIIGVLDSIHFHPRLTDSGRASAASYSSEILSVFDQLVTPLRK